MLPSFFGFPGQNMLMSMFPTQNAMMPMPFYMMPMTQGFQTDPQFHMPYVFQPPMPQAVLQLPIQKPMDGESVEPANTTEQRADSRRAARAQKREINFSSSIKQKPVAPKEPSIRYTTKNIESNVVNQVYSFLWNEVKNRKYVQKFFDWNREKICLFYEYFKIIKRSNKRYVDKYFLANLCEYREGHKAYAKIIHNPKRLDYLSMKEFSDCVRFLIKIYLLKLCPLSIVTSKKMRQEVWLRHLYKSRHVYRFLFEGEEIDPKELLEQCQNQNQPTPNQQLSQ